jgi:hypothetical protein
LVMDTGTHTEKTILSEPSHYSGTSRSKAANADELRLIKLPTV